MMIASRSTNWLQRHYDKALYKARHVIENALARLKQYRAIITRCGKTTRNFMGCTHLAVSIIWMI